MKEPFAFHPSEMARATNLMAHPAAGVMALTAIGFGMTGQALGIWAGTMSVAADASRRFWQPLIDDVASTGDGNEIQAKEDAARAPEIGEAGFAGASVVELRDRVLKASNKVVKSGFEKRNVAPAIEAPTTVDDLKLISGIGPKIEQVLKGLGVTTYAQIAAWSDKEVASIEQQLGLSGRIARDDWSGQARLLSNRSAATMSAEA